MTGKIDLSMYTAGRTVEAANKRSAFAVWLPDRERWFVRVSSGRVLSAWSLAGASLFLITDSQSGEIRQVIDKLNGLRVEYELREVLG